MTSDSDKVDRSVTKGEAAIVFLAWKAHLGSIGSKGDPPEAASAPAVSDQYTSVGGVDGGSDVGADTSPGSGQDPVRD
jgi:hypothetical protein